MRTLYSRSWRAGAIRLGASAFFCAGLNATGMAQIVYPAPPLIIQDVQWTSGTHHYSQSPAIIAPDDPEQPVEVSGTADAEFVSGTTVHLTDGFQAGSFTGDGQFRARIGDQYGDPESIVVIPSEPGAQVVDGVVHVPKWEKLEIGIELPQEYQDAIDSFFAHYYSNGEGEHATSDEVDALHDLNPYADDSLQLFMTLTKPNGQQTLKWGFHMREAEWGPQGDAARLVPDLDDPLDRYRIRFRCAPDMEGEWQVTITLKAPYTQTINNVPLETTIYSGYSFFCDPALPENKGPLSVNPINKRVLMFEDETPFFGLGPNIPDHRHGDLGQPEQGNWFKFYQRDHTLMIEAFEQLREVGGNYARMWLMDKIYGPETINLGVYDAYKFPVLCSLSESLNDPLCGIDALPAVSNSQYQCWAFDRIVDAARDNGIYIQLCVDPSPPTAAFEKIGWGAHPYVINFLDANRQAPPLNPYDLKEFFFANGESGNATPGTVFYYWKRKYKYIISRWGYSVNIPIIEPINEVDQILSYQSLPPGETLGTNTAIPTCDNAVLNTLPHMDICRENRGPWLQDPSLPGTISDWLSEITSYVRGDVDLDNPASSALGASEKLFLMSYTGAVRPTPGNPQLGFYAPFTNPAVDLLDVHQYAFPSISETGFIDWRINTAYDAVKMFRDTYRSLDQFGVPYKKPFSQGELAYTTGISTNPEAPTSQNTYEIEKIFHNYDVSFHNEIWSSAFSGKFTAGTTWHWERVFWWPEALRVPPQDPGNDLPQPGPMGSFSNVRGDANNLYVNGVQTPVYNRPLHHHFRPLANLLQHPSWVPYNFFNGDYTAHEIFDDTHQNELECYYLKNTDNNLGIGWVHNRNAWVMRSFYLTSTVQNFLGCDAPNSTSNTLVLKGFAPNSNFYVSWFPTRLNSTTHPPHTIDPIESTTTGDIIIDLTNQFGSVVGNYMDTLRADYAFIVTPAPFPKSRPPHPAPPAEVEGECNFNLYPNPASRDLFLEFSDGSSRTVELFDITGRLARRENNVTERLYHCSIAGLAMGPYWVRVTDGTKYKVKKLIVH
ncbi:MAG: T9SS type A sorting domain-containing protein [Flavobacteriales bacterium]